MNPKVRILISGDFYPGGRVQKKAVNTPEELFDTGITTLFHDSDLSVTNLECPLTRAGREHRIQKMGKHLKADPDSVNLLNYLGVSGVTLANNHIYDYGEQGLTDTLTVCKNNGIGTVGAGDTFEHATAIFYRTINGIRIAIINFAENEWANASPSRGGANPMDIVYNVRQIHEAKKHADIVLVVIHGGHELYRYPSPRMVNQYRFYAEQGASAIIGHHTHCVSGFEEHKGVPIFYSTGNFLFPSDTTFEGWYEGILISFTVDANLHLNWEIIPYHQCREELKVELLNSSEKESFLNKMNALNEVIADEIRLQEAFDEYYSLKQRELLAHLSTSAFFSNRYIRKAINKTGMERLFLRKQQIITMLNFFRCEAHRDVMFRIMNNFIRK